MVNQEKSNRKDNDKSKLLVPIINFRTVTQIQRLTQTTKRRIISNDGVMKYSILYLRIRTNDCIFQNRITDDGVFTDRYIWSDDAVPDFTMISDNHRRNNNSIFKFISTMKGEGFFEENCVC